MTGEKELRLIVRRATDRAYKANRVKYDAEKQLEIIMMRKLLHHPIFQNQGEISTSLKVFTLYFKDSDKVLKSFCRDYDINLKSSYRSCYKHIINRIEFSKCWSHSGGQQVNRELAFEFVNPEEALKCISKGYFKVDSKSIDHLMTRVAQLNKAILTIQEASHA